MYNNLLSEIPMVEKIYEEYLGLVNYYANFSRQAIFCRYFNINVERSSYLKADEATFDKYNSGVRYDVFDYTPLFYIAQVTNDIADQQDLIGQMFQGTTNIITYTINTPRIEDIIVFPYDPLSGKEIFRVTNVRAALNAKTATPAVNWYELTIEYAPLTDLKRLNTLDQFTYVLPLQKYLLQEEFVSMVTYLELMEGYFKSLQKDFDHEFELYTYTLPNGAVIAPLCINKIILEFLSTPGNNETLHSNPLRPFGVKKYCDEQFDDSTMCLYIGKKSGCTVEDSCYIHTISSDGCEFNGQMVYSGDLLNVEYEYRDVVEVEFDPYTNKYVETEGEKQNKYRTLNYHFEINIYDLALLINTWKYYVENNKFPKMGDVDFGNGLFLHEDQIQLVYRQKKPYDIHRMTSQSDYAEGGTG